MTKRQLIDEITMRNPTAKTDFLARFEEADLGAYLDHLIVARRPRLSSGGNRYAKYFVSADRMSAQAEQVFVKAPLAVAPPAPDIPMKEAAQVGDLPLERPEPVNVIQPALFAPPVASIDEPAVCSGPLRGSSEDRLTAELPTPAPAEKEIEQLPQDRPEEPAEALAGSYQGEVAPIVVFQPARPQDSTSDDIEEMGELPTLHTPYGQDLHDEDAPNDEDAPMADADEMEHEEIAVDEPMEEDPPVEEPVEEPAEETAEEEESEEVEAKPARKKRQPVAVGAEHESNNNQDSDSWLF